MIDSPNKSRTATIVAGTKISIHMYIFLASPDWLRVRSQESHGFHQSQLPFRNQSGVAKVRLDVLDKVLHDEALLGANMNRRAALP